MCQSESQWYSTEMRCNRLKSVLWAITRHTMTAFQSVQNEDERHVNSVHVCVYSLYCTISWFQITLSIYFWFIAVQPLDSPLVDLALGGNIDYALPLNSNEEEGDFVSSHRSSPSLIFSHSFSRCFSLSFSLFLQYPFLMSFLLMNTIHIAFKKLMSIDLTIWWFNAYI